MVSACARTPSLLPVDHRPFAPSIAAHDLRKKTERSVPGQRYPAPCASEAALKDTEVECREGLLWAETWFAIFILGTYEVDADALTYGLFSHCRLTLPPPVRCAVALSDGMGAKICMSISLTSCRPSTHHPDALAAPESASAMIWARGLLTFTACVYTVTPLCEPAKITACVV